MLMFCFDSLGRSLSSFAHLICKFMFCAEMQLKSQSVHSYRFRGGTSATVYQNYALRTLTSCGIVRLCADFEYGKAAIDAVLKWERSRITSEKSGDNECVPTSRKCLTI